MTLAYCDDDGNQVETHRLRLETLFKSHVSPIVIEEIRLDDDDSDGTTQLDFGSGLMLSSSPFLFQMEERPPIPQVLGGRARSLVFLQTVESMKIWKEN